ncbi:kinetochore component CENP-S-domain-containing protein [Phycomyces blakesleeanus]
MNPFANEPNEVNLQALYDAMWYYVEQQVIEEASSLGQTVTPEFIASLTEVVCRQAESMALDLEAFAKHAKRNTISMDDVKLCARRNPGLSELVTEIADDLTVQPKNKRRGDAITIGGEEDDDGDDDGDDDEEEEEGDDDEEGEEPEYDYR